MKTLTGLDEKVGHFDDTVGEALLQNMPTFRRMFLNVLGGGQAANGEEALAMFALGLKIRASTSGTVGVEDAEFAILLAKCKANPLGWQAHFLAQVMMKLKQVEECPNGLV